MSFAVKYFTFRKSEQIALTIIEAISTYAYEISIFDEIITDFASNIAGGHFFKEKR